MMHVRTPHSQFAGTDSRHSSMRPLRVLHVGVGYPPYAGGLETHMHEVTRRMAAQGVDVTVVTVDLNGSLAREETLEGVKVRRVRGRPANREFTVAPGIHRVIAKGNWDLVHCQGVHTLVPPMAMFSALRAGIPYVLTFHSGGHSSSSRNALRSTQWKALRPLLARAARLIAVSNFEAKHFQAALRLPADHFVMIQNGSFLPPVPEDAPPADGTLLVSLGRLERYKGHQRVIAALPYVLESVPDARLLIIGSGPYESDLLRLAARIGVADRVEIRTIAPGDRAEMATVLAGASLMTLLSEYEAHPIAVMEALAAKCPVLVSDTSGLKEIADQGLARSVPLSADGPSVAAAVMEQLRRPLVPSGFALPTWEGCTDKLLALYREITVQSKCAS